MAEPVSTSRIAKRSSDSGVAGGSRIATRDRTATGGGSRIGTRGDRTGGAVAQAGTVRKLRAEAEDAGLLDGLKDSLAGPTNLVTRALQLVDKPRAIVLAAAEQLDTHDVDPTTGPWEEFSDAVASNRGFGDRMHEMGPDDNIWVKRAAGFVGDVVLDPLTYLTGGASVVAKVGAKGAGRALGEVAEEGAEAGAERVTNRLLSSDDVARRLENLVGNGMTREAASAAQEQVLSRGTAQLSKETAALVGVRTGMSMGVRNARVMIPGSERLARATGRVGGEARVRLGRRVAKVPGIRALPAKLEILPGLTEFKRAHGSRAAWAMRTGWSAAKDQSDAASSVLARDLGQIADKWHGQVDDGELRVAIETGDRSTSSAGAADDIAVWLEKARVVASTAKGAPVARYENYLPHRLTAEFRAHLVEGGRPGGKRGKGGKGGEATLALERSLRPGTEWMGVELVDGNIDELHQIAKQTLGGDYIKIFKDDPWDLLQSYLHEVQGIMHRGFFTNELVNKGMASELDLAALNAKVKEKMQLEKKSGKAGKAAKEAQARADKRAAEAATRAAQGAGLSAADLRVAAWGARASEASSRADAKAITPDVKAARDQMRRAGVVNTRSVLGLPQEPAVGALVAAEGAVGPAAQDLAVARQVAAQEATEGPPVGVNVGAISRELSDTSNAVDKLEAVLSVDDLVRRADQVRNMPTGPMPEAQANAILDGLEKADIEATAGFEARWTELAAERQAAVGHAEMVAATTKEIEDSVDGLTADLVVEMRAAGRAHANKVVGQEQNRLNHLFQGRELGAPPRVSYTRNALGKRVRNNGAGGEWDWFYAMPLPGQMRVRTQMLPRGEGDGPDGLLSAYNKQMGTDLEQDEVMGIWLGMKLDIMDGANFAKGGPLPEGERAAELFARPDAFGMADNMDLGVLYRLNPEKARGKAKVAQEAELVDGIVTDLKKAFIDHEVGRLPTHSGRDLEVIRSEIAEFEAAADRLGVATTERYAEMDAAVRAYNELPDDGRKFVSGLIEQDRARLVDQVEAPIERKMGEIGGEVTAKLFGGSKLGSKPLSNQPRRYIEEATDLVEQRRVGLESQLDQADLGQVPRPVSGPSLAELAGARKPVAAVVPELKVMTDSAVQTRREAVTAEAQVLADELAAVTQVAEEAGAAARLTAALTRAAGPGGRADKDVSRLEAELRRTRGRIAETRAPQSSQSSQSLVELRATEVRQVEELGQAVAATAREAVDTGAANDVFSAAVRAQSEVDGRLVAKHKELRRVEMEQALRASDEIRVLRDVPDPARVGRANRVVEAKAARLAAAAEVVESERTLFNAAGAARHKAELAVAHNETNLLRWEMEASSAQGARKDRLDVATMLGEDARRLFDAADEVDGTPAVVARLEALAKAESAEAELHGLTSTEFLERAKRAVTVEEVETLNRMKDGALKELSDGRWAEPEVADAVKRAVDSLTPQKVHALLKIHDTFMSRWKGYSLLSPGFHIRNFLGGMFNNSLDGMDVKWYGKWDRAQRQFKKGGYDAVRDKEMRGILAEAHKYPIVMGGNHIREMGDLDRLGGAVTRGVAGERGKVRIGGREVNLDLTANDNVLFKLNHKAAGGVEEHLRGPLFASRMAAGESVEDALAAVRKYHFDYDELSWAEKNVARRIMPFWTWTRKNFPLMIEMMWRRPGRFTTFQHAKDNIELGTEDEEVVPAYYKNLLAIHTPFQATDQGPWFTKGEPGADIYLSLDLPFRNLAQTFSMSTMLGSVSPVIKMPLELFAGKQFFTGIPFKEGAKGLAPMPAAFYPLLPFMASPLGGQLGFPKATRTDNGTWVMKEIDAYKIEQSLPLLGRLRRLFPNEQRYQDRAITSYLSVIGGLSTITNSQDRQYGELRRQAKILQEALKTNEVLTNAP